MTRSIPRIFVVCALSVAAVTHGYAQDDNWQAKAAAKTALDEFFAAWNTADNVEIRKKLNFPHLSLFGDRMVIATEPEEFSTDFDRMRRDEGWRRSTLDAIEFGSVSSQKVHCTVTYSRWNDTAAYRTAKVFYVMTNVDDHWGMQFRAPYLGAENANATVDSRKLLDDFFVAFNASDNKTLQAITNYPHAFLVGNGRVSAAKAPANLVMNFQGMTQREGWHRSTLDSVDEVYVSGRVAIFDIVFSRHKSDGTKYRTVPATWILTNGGDHWGIQFRSLMPPTFSLQD